jgi:hypothetical protein
MMPKFIPALEVIAIFTRASEVIDGLAVKRLYGQIRDLKARIAQTPEANSGPMRSRLRDCEIALTVRIARMVERGERLPNGAQSECSIDEGRKQSRMK